jgi:hypothetical protein
MDGDRPSWIADTLSGDETPSLALEIAAFAADLDRLDEVLRRYERESDKPPPDEPPPDAASALVPEAA